jgi:hypothetical protein
MLEERDAVENKFEDRSEGTKLESINNKLDNVSQGLDAIGNKLDDISNKLDAMKHQLDLISQLLTLMSQRELHNYRDRCITAVDIYSRLGYGMLCYICPLRRFTVVVFTQCCSDGGFLCFHDLSGGN